jgi:hypothetical protein
VSQSSGGGLQALAEFLYRTIGTEPDFAGFHNGKFLVIGLYTPDIAVPQIPFVLLSLTLFQVIESHQAGKFQFNSSLQFLETGAKLVQAIGMIEEQQPGLLYNITHFGNLKIQSPGTHTFTTQFSQLSEPIIRSK